MSHFDAQTNHPDPVVAEAATMLQQFSAQLEAGELSETEFKELTYDLLDMQRIDKLALDLQHKADIQKAFQQLLQIAGMIGKFL